MSFSEPPFDPGPQIPTSPPFYPPPNPADRVEDQPRWGFPDIPIGVIFIIIGATLSFLIAVVVLPGARFSDGLVAEQAGVLALSGLGMQAFQFGWPVLVSKWKGFGIVKDFGFRFSFRDIWTGPVLGLATAFVAGVVGVIVGTALDVADSEEASNSGFLSEHQDSPWIYAIVFMVIVGAPLSEELFFRGFVMSAIDKRMGPLAGLIGSTALFVLPHFTGAPWRETIVIFSVISVVGLSLGSIVQRTGRLGPAIMAHATFNSMSVLVVLSGAV